MEISKSIIKVLTVICKDKNKLKDIAKAVRLSISRISEIISELEKLNFVKKIRRGNVVYIDLSDTSFAQSFKELVHTMTHINFEDFLYGLNFRILDYCLFGYKTTQNIAEQLKTSVKAIQNRISILNNRGLFEANKRLLRTNKLAWPALYKFLEEYRMFSKIKGKILWKFENEILYESDIEGEGEETGFYAYDKYGIKIIEPFYCYYLPKKKLSLEEIFIHSLLEIDHPRTFALALTFYIKYKNKLDNKKLNNITMKYDCYNKLREFMDTYSRIKAGITRVMGKYLPGMTRNELEDTLKLYNVKQK